MTEPEVIYEDKNFLAVNKPAGLLVHQARVSNFQPPISKEPTLVDWLLERHPEVGAVGDDPKTRPGIVHRLDKGTSGVMLVARNQKYFKYLKSLFQNHEIKKIYLALVFGKVEPKEGTIKKSIGIKGGTLKRSIHSQKMLKDAVTEYKMIKYISDERQRTSDKGFSLVEVRPQTGRTHQIRLHLASIGHPVVGDALYGPKRQPKFADRLMLHALSLEFSIKDGKRFKIEAELPRQFLDLSGSGS